jgi:hypothetical protein
MSLRLLPRAITPCPLAAEFREPVSHCRVCGRDVLDLSQYTAEEAARLLSTAEPPCVRVALRNGVPIFRTVAQVAAVTALAAGAAAAISSRLPAPPPALPAIETVDVLGGAIVEPPPPQPTGALAGRIGPPLPPPPPSMVAGEIAPPARETGGKPVRVDWVPLLTTGYAVQGGTAVSLSGAPD